MSDDVINQPMDDKDISFAKQEMIPSDLNLSLVTKITLNQLISLKAKVINLQKPQKVANGTLRKAEAILVDEHGSIKILFWQEDIDKIENDETYQFKDLSVKKDKYSGEIYVNPAKGLCLFTKCEAFTGQLAMPQNMPTEFLNSQVTTDILGVADIKKEFCCLRCNRQVNPQKIATCNNPKCNLKQKLSSCPQQ